MLRPPNPSAEIKDPRPGFSEARLLKLMDEAIVRLALDLRGINVLTEAANGAYATTAVLAARAGANQVFACARDNKWGSCGDHVRATLALAEACGVADRIEMLTGSPRAAAFKSQIITNSGSLRPIGAEIIGRLPSDAIIALMYEAWEFRSDDVDIAACNARNLLLVGVNERHPNIDVWGYLGPLAIFEMHQAGIAVCHGRIALLCDNDFADPIIRSINALGGEVVTAPSVDSLPNASVDAVLIALKPQDRMVFAASDAETLIEHWGRVPIVQFWGDADREALRDLELPIWPQQAPSPGHMGILLASIGPEPVIGLQAGGLKAAEVVFRQGPSAAGPDKEAQLLNVNEEIRPCL